MSTSVSQVAMRSTPPGAPNSKIGLLAIDVDRALTRERPRPDDIEVGGLDRRVEGNQNVGRHLPKIGRRRGCPVDATVALDDRRPAARALGALAAADCDGDERAGGHRRQGGDRRDGLAARDQEGQDEGQG